MESGQGFSGEDGYEAPVHWRLLTTHRTERLEDALRYIDWYRQCWMIEQLFRTLKKQGLDVGSSQVETGEGLTKLACLALQAAVPTRQLTQVGDGGNSAQAADVFNPDEVELLQRLQPTLEGKTEKQRNPHDPGSLAQAARVVARPGGWGYASEAKPGPITLLHDLKRLAAICHGWTSAKKDVCID